jgi:hypothetical protein
MRIKPLLLSLLAAATVMISMLACLDPQLLRESIAETEEMQLLTTLWAQTQTAEAQITKTIEPTLTPYPTLTSYPTFTAEAVMVTVTLVNENCADQYFFADGVFVAFVPAYGTSSFEIKAGDYMLLSCVEMEQINCGAPNPESFTEDTVHRIYAHPGCKP